MLVYPTTLCNSSPGHFPASWHQNVHVYADPTDGRSLLTGLQRRQSYKLWTSKNVTPWSTKRGNWGIATWSDACSHEAASTFNISQPHICSGSSPITAPIVASLFMRSPICYQLNGPTWYHQVGHGTLSQVINSTVARKFICSRLLLSLLKQAVCTVWWLESEKKK